MMRGARTRAARALRHDAVGLGEMLARARDHRLAGLREARMRQHGGGLGGQDAASCSASRGR